MGREGAGGRPADCRRPSPAGLGALGGSRREKCSDPTANTPKAPDWPEREGWPVRRHQGVLGPHRQLPRPRPVASGRICRSRGANRLSARKLLGSGSKYAERADLHRKGALVPARRHQGCSNPYRPSRHRQCASTPPPLHLSRTLANRRAAPNRRPDREKLEKRRWHNPFSSRPGRPSLRRRNGPAVRLNLSCYDSR